MVGELDSPDVSSFSFDFSNGTGELEDSFFFNDYNINENNFNDSFLQIYCYLTAFNETYIHNDSSPYCNTTWDGLSCWPRTQGGSVAVLPCFSYLNDLQYDTAQNASRVCLQNGSWAIKSDYSNCRPLAGEMEREPDAAPLYYIGYGMSLCALTIALWIFLYYKELRCLRNIIHTNLMVTYILVAMTWITTASLQSSQTPSGHKTACVLYILLMYLMTTNFFWMFVEGLYLYILVVKTFSIELVKFHVYALIGWGVPAVVVAVWAATRAYVTPYQNELSESAYQGSSQNSLVNDPLLSNEVCPWNIRNYYDCIVICPVILVLVINIFFLAEIMWVLITKLRAATSVESQQYRKAAKALLVLIPLLGVTYILVIYAPTHRTLKIVFTFLQAVLLSTQGFTVAILYCFLNGEVRNAVRHHMERWKTTRAMRSGSADTNRHSLSYRYSQQGETVRLYKGRTARDRGSCVSFTTTTTCVGNSCNKCSLGQRHSNGSYGPVPTKDDAV